MSRGLGRIERAILASIEATYNSRCNTIRESSWSVASDVFEPPRGWQSGSWEPTAAQRKATTRAMRSFVRKHPRYALMGGQGRKHLWLYEPGDPVSAMWVKMTVEQRKFVSRSEATIALRRARDELTTSEGGAAVDAPISVTGPGGPGVISRTATG